MENDNIVMKQKAILMLIAGARSFISLLLCIKPALSRLPDKNKNAPLEDSSFLTTKTDHILV